MSDYERSYISEEKEPVVTTSSSSSSASFHEANEKDLVQDGQILHAQLTRITTILTRQRTIEQPLAPPPDGGLAAWTQVAMAHLVVINTWGTINSFGIFQTYYVSSLNRPPSDISWIGSMQVFFLFSIGVFTGRLVDAGYFRQVFALGSFLAVFGSFMTSLCTTYEQLFLAQGVCIGLGMGCLFCPMTAVLSTYFHKRRNLAMGLAISGSATGGVVFPLMVRQLMDRIGFEWTMRCMAFVQLTTLLVANAFTRTRIPARRSGPLIEWKAFKEPVYTLFALGSFFVRALGTARCRTMC